MQHTQHKSYSLTSPYSNLLFIFYTLAKSIIRHSVNPKARYFSFSLFHSYNCQVLLILSTKIFSPSAYSAHVSSVFFLSLFTPQFFSYSNFLPILSLIHPPLLSHQFPDDRALIHIPHLISHHNYNYGELK